MAVAEIEQDLEMLCALACLDLDPAEKRQMGRCLGALMKVLSKVQEIDTRGVEPGFHQAAPPLRLREDEVNPSLPPDRVFENSTGRSGDYFQVPRIAGDEQDDI